MNFKNIKTDTDLQYLFHGSKPREVKHMDVYLEKYVDAIDVKVSPNSIGVQEARMESLGHSNGGWRKGHEPKKEGEEARELRKAHNGILFTLSTDEALAMATQLLMAIGQIKQRLEEVA